MIHKLIRQLAPIAAAALSVAVAGCGDMKIDIDGATGVPLAELDMSGDAPTKLVLAGPDKVVLSEGEALEINVEGDAKAIELVRFALKEGALIISREDNEWKNAGTAIVRITMPLPSEMVIAGSGAAEAPAIADNGKIVIAGSGKATISNLASSKAEVTIAGSGSLMASGAADELELNIVGSGKADMEGLKVDRAGIRVAGSGDATFASDGTVEADMLGSGDVRVIGRATCTINAVGSGTLRCEPAASEEMAAE